jgi:hypothetical protein
VACLQMFAENHIKLIIGQFHQIQTFTSIWNGSGLICETVLGMRGHSWALWYILVEGQQGIEPCGGVLVERSTSGRKLGKIPSL